MAEGTREAATKTGRRMQAWSKRSEHVKEAREFHQKLRCPSSGLDDERAKGKWGLAIPKCHDGSAACCGNAAFRVQL